MGRDGNQEFIVAIKLRFLRDRSRPELTGAQSQRDLEI